MSNTCLDNLRKVSRETFIADHALVCNASPARKYDEKKATWSTHSLEYSRRKCAKNLWRKLQKKSNDVRGMEIHARGTEGGMSLTSFYVDQIMRPSFLPNLGEAMRRPKQSVADAKRQNVLECLQSAGKPVTATWVMDHTGYTRQCVMHVLYTLQEKDLVKRIDKPEFITHPGNTFLLWEAK